jgi:isopenicillin-N N-acyltransferase-like protein
VRCLDLRECAGGSERGLLHGQRFAGEIASLCAIRIYLACKISGFERDALLKVADAHLPILQAFDEDLYQELTGIAEGAGLPASYIVILNQYTDIRDLSPMADPDEGLAGEVDFDGGCTIVWARGPSGPLFGQTWDMHATAMPYVMMLRVPDAAGGDAWLLSLTGCLGMAGLNAAGLSIGINNLTSTDARPGVVWSAIVRKAMRESKATCAKDLLLQTRTGSGHHYLVSDEKEVFSVETSGTKNKLIFSGEADDFVHSNHCLDSEVGACSRVPAKSTTCDRYDAMVASLASRSVVDVEDLWARLGSHDGYPKSVCTNMSTPENPHAAATCAGIAIDVCGRKLLVVGGFTHHVEPDRFELQKPHGDKP